MQPMNGLNELREQGRMTWIEEEHGWIAAPEEVRAEQGRQWARERSPQPPRPAHSKLEEENLAMKIRPLHDRMLVKRVEEQDARRGGIIIPDTAKEKPQEGKVVAVGNGKMTDEGKKISLDVKAGDRILFGKFSGNEVKIEDEEYLIMREEDVLAILE